jgi:hypothetical protein
MHILDWYTKKVENKDWYTKEETLVLRKEISEFFVEPVMDQILER